MIQCSTQSPEFSIPSQLRTPDDTIIEAIISPEKSSKKKQSKSTNSDSNNNTPVVSPKKSQGEEPQAISVKKTSSENNQFIACSSNAVQPYIAPTVTTTLPPVSTILPPFAGKKNKVNFEETNQHSHELFENEKREEPKVRKSDRLKRANTVTPMGGVKYV